MTYLRSKTTLVAFIYAQSISTSVFSTLRDMLLLVPLHIPYPLAASCSHLEEGVAETLVFSWGPP